MIDPLSAFLAAQAAIKGVKAVLQMGKDVQGITGDLMKFFDAKDVIAKAATKAKPGQSVNSEAMRNVMNLHSLQEQEKEIKELLIYSGHGDLWHLLLLERLKIAKQRKADELAAEKKRAAAAKEIEEVMTYAAAAAVVLLLIGGVIWITLEVVK